MITENIAPFPQKECPSVSEYNRHNYGKAWAIVGMTWQGSAYCVAAECSGDWPTYEDDLIESPMPIFASDEHEGMTCDHCHERI